LLEHTRSIGSRTVLDGVFGVAYNVTTLEEIDGNLSDLHWNPSHPDIDRLLDVRKWVRLVQPSWHRNNEGET
jgi:hypothetical protein